MALDFDEIGQIETECASYLASISAECEQILRDEIYDSVYMSYHPTQYKRTNQLLNNLDMEFTTDGALHLFFNGLDYTSAVDESDQSDNVPFFINDGHRDGGTGMYHNYPKRQFLEKAAKRIRAKFGVKVSIVKD